MAGKFSTEQATSAQAYGTILKEHTPADADLPINVKAVFFDADGTCDIKNPDGTAVTGVPVAKGYPITVVPARITAMTGPTKCYLVMG